MLQWFGHVERMEEKHLVKKITRSDVRGVRPLMRWLDSVKRALGARGLSAEQGRVVVCDRIKWRAIGTSFFTHCGCWKINTFVGHIFSAPCIVFEQYNCNFVNFAAFFPVTPCGNNIENR